MTSKILFNKRKDQEELIEQESKKRRNDSSSDDDDQRPVCKYGESCYQKNTYHLNKFRHPHREIPEKMIDDSSKLLDNTIEIEQKSECQKKEVGEGMEMSLSKNETTFLPEDSDPPLITSKEEKKELLPPSPTNVKENIKQKYLTEMPGDFYLFWEFCQFISKEKPCEAFQDTLGIELVGPFQILDPTRKQAELKTLDDYLTQWRFYYDPPEFQTLLIGCDTAKGYHIGYFRDSPKELPAFVGYNYESEDCKITPMADNIFAAIEHLVLEKLKKADPFLKTKLTTLKKQMEKWVKDNDISSLLNESQSIKDRKKLVVAKTFYTCGIVVPFNKKTKVGYREIPETDSNLKKMLKKISESQNEDEQNKNSEALQELVTYVQFANDEMDWGMGLELGLDLLAFGGEVFHSTIMHLLNVAYELLQRKEFATVLAAHLKNRRKISSGKSISE